MILLVGISEITQPRYSSLIDGGYLYTPNQDFNGFDEVQFIAIDDQNISYELNASMNVVSQNDDPSAMDDELDLSRWINERND